MTSASSKSPVTVVLEEELELAVLERSIVEIFAVAAAGVGDWDAAVGTACDTNVGVGAGAV
jgi:hypothetical protein